MPRVYVVGSLGFHQSISSGIDTCAADDQDSPVPQLGTAVCPTRIAPSIQGATGFTTTVAVLVIIWNRRHPTTPEKRHTVPSARVSDHVMEHSSLQMALPFMRLELQEAVPTSLASTTVLIGLGTSSGGASRFGAVPGSLRK